MNIVFNTMLSKRVHRGEYEKHKLQTYLVKHVKIRPFCQAQPDLTCMSNYACFPQSLQAQHIIKACGLLCMPICDVLLIRDFAKDQWVCRGGMIRWTRNGCKVAKAVLAWSGWDEHQLRHPAHWCCSHLLQDRELKLC